MATKAKTSKIQTALVLRCCKADMSSKNGFVWPAVGGVAIAADWIDNTECGNGLHGWLYGQGDHSTSAYFSLAAAKWLVVEVAFSAIRMLGGKCKFQSGKVVFCGEKSEAAAYILKNEPQALNVAVIGAILECGEKGVLQGGALSVLTGGDSATMTGGNYATMTGGNSATMTGGNSSVMHFTYYDGKRIRTVIAYVGEDGIKPDTAYKLDSTHKVVEVTV